jgi:hypothetical protein
MKTADSVPGEARVPVAQCHPCLPRRFSLQPAYGVTGVRSASVSGPLSKLMDTTSCLWLFIAGGEDCP